jgi:hypothetical protein
MNFYRYFEKRQIHYARFRRVRLADKISVNCYPPGQHDATQIVRLTEAIIKVIWIKPVMTLPQ